MKIRFWKIFLLIFKKYFFFNEKKKLRFFLDNHFDVEFCQESIFRIHKCNGAVLKVQNTLWRHPTIFDFLDSSNFIGSIRYFIGSQQQKKIRQRNSSLALIKKKIKAFRSLSSSVGLADCHRKWVCSQLHSMLTFMSQPTCRVISRPTIIIMFVKR